MTGISSDEKVHKVSSKAFTNNFVSEIRIMSDCFAFPT